MEFRGKEKQWTVEKASLRREADAQRRQAGKLHHQLDKLQVSRCTSQRTMHPLSISSRSPRLMSRHACRGAIGADCVGLCPHYKHV